MTRPDLIRVQEAKSWRRLSSWCLPVMFMLSFLYVTPVMADAILVIANKDAPVDDLNRAAAAELFLGLRPELRLVPFDQNDDALRERFYRAMAEMSPKSVRAHWAKQVFTGRGQPPARLSTDETSRTVTSRTDAVTYVPAGKLPAGSKVLLSIPNGAKP